MEKHWLEENSNLTYMMTLVVSLKTQKNTDKLQKMSAICTIACWCTPIATTASNMDTDQTVPLGSVWSGFIHVWGDYSEIGLKWNNYLQYSGGLRQVMKDSSISHTAIPFQSLFLFLCFSPFLCDVAYGIMRNIFYLWGLGMDLWLRYHMGMLFSMFSFSIH